MSDKIKKLLLRKERELDINNSFYDKDEVRHLIDTEDFSSRAQVLAYFYTEGCLDKYF